MRPPMTEGRPVAQGALLPATRRMVVAVGGSAGAIEAIHAAAALAKAIGASWHAVHVETPRPRSGTDLALAAEALGLAASLGASVAKVPAADVVEGLISQIEDQGATDLLLCRSSPSGWRRLVRPPLAEAMAKRAPHLTIHLLPASAAADERQSPHRPAAADESSAGLRPYLYAVGYVVLTAAAIEPVWQLTGARGVDLLFLLPVIAASVRHGLRQGILAAALSVVFYNFLFLSPVFRFVVNAPQNAVMLAVLLGVAIYTGMISEQLRGRLRLSDRSAKENAAIVTFAQELTRAANWEETADAVCRPIAAMLDVRAAVVREKEGELIVAGAVPATPSFGPIDHMALDWTWQHGEESGHGTQRAAAADWQFHPLATSLGTMAVLALARDDGAPPIPADRAMLLSTLIAQASLAHERLKLEDEAIAAARAS